MQTDESEQAIILGLQSIYNNLLYSIYIGLHLNNFIFKCNATDETRVNLL